MNKEPLINALCIDVDDLCLTYAEQGCKVRQNYCGVDRETEVLLEHLDELAIKATFFFPGLAVKKSPRLINMIISGGHELASHGWIHKPIQELGEEKFRQDIIRSKRTLEDLSGSPVSIYKAPIWSITENTMWAFDVLADEGIKIDHSAMPRVKKKMGFNPDYMLPIVHSSGLILIPPTTINIWGVTIPMPGGFYAAYFPDKLLINQYKKLNDLNINFNFYFHPFEHNLSSGNQRKVKGGSLRVTLTSAHSGCYYSLLEKLAKHFKFSTLSMAYGGSLESLLET